MIKKLFNSGLRKFASLVILNGILSLLSFFHLMFLAKYLGASEFGELSTVLVYGTILLQLSLFGTSENGINLLRSGYNEEDINSFSINKHNIDFFSIFFFCIIA